MLSGGLRARGIRKESRENMPLITVITVVRNGEKTLEQTILSVINQTYANIEYIVVDGVSTDNTLDIIRKYEDRIDYWQSEPDGGIYYAMNKGINLARGDYIALLNSDDYYEYDTCKIIADNITKTHKDIYYGIMRVLDLFGKVNFIYGYLMATVEKSMIAHPTCFIAKSIYQKYLYNTKYRSAADYDFILKIRNAAEFYFVDKILASYRLGGNSDSLLGKLETINIRRKYRLISITGYVTRFLYYHFLSLNSFLSRKFQFLNRFRKAAVS
jgi:glycosyltransferase involved in cell wall biosynthesis